MQSSRNWPGLWRRHPSQPLKKPFPSEQNRPRKPLVPAQPGTACTDPISRTRVGPTLLSPNCGSLLTNQTQKRTDLGNYEIQLQNLKLKKERKKLPEGRIGGGDGEGFGGGEDRSPRIHDGDCDGDGCDCGFDREEEEGENRTLDPGWRFGCCSETSGCRKAPMRSSCTHTHTNQRFLTSRS